MLAVLLITALIVQSVSSENQENKCRAKTCEDCMAQGPPCYWCFDPNLGDRDIGPRLRCATLDELLKRGCASNSTLRVKSTSKVKDNEKPSDNPIVQLFPQRINVKVRPKEPLTVTVNYQQARNHPLDLYYLTDMSYSMYTYLTVISQQAQVIADTMKNLTTKFRMGFGTFVDKPIFPFIDNRPKDFENPCRKNEKENLKCDPPYGYHHILSLTSDISKFQKITNSTKPSGNLDGPEGGLDALLQASLCDRIVGWSPKARKIILFTTDAGFHLAGDGRFAGIIDRFVEKCSMKPLASNKNVYNYDRSTDLDYPSIGQVIRTLKDKGIGVIFAITKKFKPLYDNIADVLPSASVGVLDGNSDDIANLIRENYHQISSSVGLAARVPDDRIKVRVTPVCPEASKSKQDSGPKTVKMCHGVPLGGQIKFNIEVTLSACLNQSVNVTLYPTNLESEVLTLNVDSACSCEGKCGGFVDIPPEKAPRCTEGRGNLSCGVCVCEEGFSGDFCECSANRTTSEDDLSCKVDGSDKICSDRGRCECGTCRCSSNRYQGRLCECDLRACPIANDNGHVCGGDERGTCTCNNTCACKPGYTGVSCDCLIDQNYCRSNDTTEESEMLKTNSSMNATEDVLCSGRGTCDCGLCICDEQWTGLTCSERRGGQGRLCQNEPIKDCVLCALAQNLGETGVRDTDCKCRDTRIAQVNFVEEHNKKDVPSLCVIYDRSNCRIYFTYRYESTVRTDRGIVITIQRTRECPSRTNILLILLAAILFVLLIGILLLIIWKVCITIHDRHVEAQTLKVDDFACFEAGSNPIYKPPITTVHNPLCETTPCASPDGPAVRRRL